MENLSLDIVALSKLMEKAAQSEEKRDENENKDSQAGDNSSIRTIPQKQSSQNDDLDTETTADCDPLPDNNDPRLPLDFKIMYQQKVTTEDVFLQTGNKTPLTSSCECLQVKVTFPDGTEISDIDLDVRPRYLKCHTLTHCLILPLPHLVDPDESKAKFNSDEAILTITLPLKRDLDFINF